MAKAAVEARGAADPAVPEQRITFDSLSAGLRRQVTGLKRSVTDIAQKFGVVREKAKDLWPKLRVLLNDIKAAHPDTEFTFVDFARLFAADLPTHAADKDGVMGYRNHPVYYTLSYMQRQAQRKRTGKQGVRDTAVDGFARAIATCLQVVPPDVMYPAIQQALGYDERIMGRLRRRVAATKPILQINLPPKASVKVGNVIQMPRQTASAAAAGEGTAAVEAATAGLKHRLGESLNQPGRRVRRAG